MYIIFIFSQPCGMMETAIPYSSIEDVHIISRWDAGQKFCIRITIPDGSLLIQVRYLEIIICAFSYHTSYQLGGGDTTLISAPGAIIVEMKLLYRIYKMYDI